MSDRYTENNDYNTQRDYARRIDELERRVIECEKCSTEERAGGALRNEKERQIVDNVQRLDREATELRRAQLDASKEVVQQIGAVNLRIDDLKVSFTAELTTFKQDVSNQIQTLKAGFTSELLTIKDGITNKIETVNSKFDSSLLATNKRFDDALVATNTKFEENRTYFSRWFTALMATIITGLIISMFIFVLNR